MHWHCVLSKGIDIKTGGFIIRIISRHKHVQAERLQTFLLHLKHDFFAELSSLVHFLLNYFSPALGFLMALRPIRRKDGENCPKVVLENRIDTNVKKLGNLL